MSAMTATHPDRRAAGARRRRRRRDRGQRCPGRRGLLPVPRSLRDRARRIGDVRGRVAAARHRRRGDGCLARGVRRPRRRGPASDTTTSTPSSRPWLRRRRTCSPGSRRPGRCSARGAASVRCTTSTSRQRLDDAISLAAWTPVTHRRAVATGPRGGGAAGSRGPRGRRELPASGDGRRPRRSDGACAHRLPHRRHGPRLQRLDVHRAGHRVDGGGCRGLPRRRARRPDRSAARRGAVPRARRARRRRNGRPHRAVDPRRTGRGPPVDGVRPRRVSHRGPARRADEGGRAAHRRCRGSSWRCGSRRRRNGCSRTRSPGATCTRTSSSGRRS